MNYHSLRHQIYVNEIKQLLAATSRIGVLVAVFFGNVLIPAILMGALMAIAIIADKELSLAERIVYQTVYLLLLFVTIKVQAKAIRAIAYQYYIRDLPVSSLQHIRSDLLLTLVAGNLTLLAPLGLCLFIPDLNALFDSLFFVVFALAVLLLALVALYRNNIPFLSLLAVPLSAAILLPDPLLLNGLWLLAIAFELLFVDRFKLSWQHYKVSGYSRVLWLFVGHRRINFVVRGLGVLALTGSYSYLIGKRPDLALNALQVSLSLPLGLLLGSYQFEIERFRSQYRYYLQGLPLRHSNMRLTESLPLVVLLTVGLVCVSWVGFGWLPVVALVLFTFSAALGVVHMDKYYFVPPGLILLGFVPFV